MIITKEMDSKTLDSLGALALDLKRISLGLQRGSVFMADRFIKEAVARKKELYTPDLDKYLLKLLDKMEKSFKALDNSKKAEDALMYSALFQNASLKK